MTDRYTSICIKGFSGRHTYIYIYKHTTYRAQMNYQTPIFKGGKQGRSQNPNGSTIAHRYITDKIQSQIHVPLGYR